MTHKHIRRKALPAALSLLLAMLIFVGCAPQAPTEPSTVPTTAAPTTEPPHVHDYQLTTQILPSCEESGVDEYVCACGDAKTCTIDATGHAFAGGSCQEAAVCTGCGLTGENVHNLVNCVCADCGTVVLTLEQLQGTWAHSEGYERITVTGDMAFVHWITGDITYSGPVQLQDYGFCVEGTYQYTDGNGDAQEGRIKTTCIISELTDTYFVDTFDDDGPFTWYKE